MAQRVGRVDADEAEGVEEGDNDPGLAAAALALDVRGQFERVLRELDGLADLLSMGDYYWLHHDVQEAIIDMISFRAEAERIGAAVPPPEIDRESGSRVARRDALPFEGESLRSTGYLLRTGGHVRGRGEAGEDVGQDLAPPTNQPEPLTPWVARRDALPFESER